MPRTRLMAWIGAAILAVGLLVGFMPTSAIGVNCGSVFVASRDAAVADFSDTLLGSQPRTGMLGGVSAACDDKRGDRRTLVTVILAVGAMALIAAYVLSEQARRGAARSPQT